MRGMRDDRAMTGPEATGPNANEGRIGRRRAKVVWGRLREGGPQMSDRRELI